ncbi:MAG: ABC transporter permease [Planctomycetota bacterium]
MIDLTAPLAAMTPHLGPVSTPAFVSLLGQQQNWWPEFVTPLWLISVGLILGAVVSIAVYLIAMVLSFTPLGKLADDPKVGTVASLVVGGAIAAVLWTLYLPRLEGDEYAYFAIPPLGVIGVVLGFAIVYGMWHRTRREWGTILSEGVVPYLLWTAIALAVVGLAGTALVDDRNEILESIPRVNAIFDGTGSFEVEIPGNDVDVNPDDAPFVPANQTYTLRNLAELTIESDRTVLLGDASDPAAFTGPPTEVDPGVPLKYRFASREKPPIPGDSTLLHIQNREIDPARLTMTFASRPDVPEAASVIVIAVMFFLALSTLVAFRQAAPRVWALALSTAKNEMAQPLYLLLLGFGIAIVLFFGFFPFNTLGDDIRVFKDSGITLIMILGMLQAVWSAGTSVSEEIEGRTALTVLSKPVSRRSFILGKYAGIMLSVLVLFAIIAAVFLVVMSYKPIYELRETTRENANWRTGHDEIMSALPIFGLALMQTATIASVAVALATRLPLLANFVTCFSVYVLGNLIQPIVQSTGNSNPLVQFMGNLLAIPIPNLNTFNVQAAIDAGNSIPILYVAASFNYLVCFAIFIWMVALLLFEDRDLA